MSAGEAAAAGHRCGGRREPGAAAGTRRASGSGRSGVRLPLEEAGRGAPGRGGVAPVPPSEPPPGPRAARPAGSPRCRRGSALPGPSERPAVPGQPRCAVLLAGSRG